MWVETHRCSVEGCPNLAAYEVIHYDFDVNGGAIVFEPDPDRPTICAVRDARSRTSVARWATAGPAGSSSTRSRTCTEFPG